MKTIQERFWDKVHKQGPQDCWAWQNSTDGKGYGKINIAGKFVQVHRLSYELHKGRIPVGLDVLHTCDNPPCVNPAHLVAGTKSDNMQDCVRKGRHADLRGEKSPRAVLTAEQVLQIRREHIPFKYGYHKLAKKYGVTVPTIQAIIERRSWQHI